MLITGSKPIVLSDLKSSSLHPTKVFNQTNSKQPTIAFNATFVPRSSIVFISDFDRTIFFFQSHMELLQDSMWPKVFIEVGGFPCQGAASDPLGFISSCHSGSPTHISPAFNLGFAKNNGILSPKARGCPELDNSNNN